MEAQGHPLSAPAPEHPLAPEQPSTPEDPPTTSTAMDVDAPVKHVRWPDEMPSQERLLHSDRVLAKTLSDKLSRVAEMEGDRGVISHPKQLSDVLQQLSLSHGNDSITREEVRRGR